MPINPLLQALYEERNEIIKDILRYIDIKEDADKIIKEKSLKLMELKRDIAYQEKFEGLSQKQSVILANNLKNIQLSGD